MSDDAEDWFEEEFGSDGEKAPDVEAEFDPEETGFDDGDQTGEDGDPLGGAPMADDPGGGPAAGGGDPFGGGSDPFGGGADDFAGAFDAGGGDTGFEEELDSEIPRIDLGIEGLENGEKGVYITLEEDREAVLQAAEEKGWPFEQYVEEESLAVVDLDPIEMANSLASIRSDLPRLVREFDAERLVLDSVSLLEMMYDQQAQRRTEIFDFTKSLKEAGVTTMLTSEAKEGNPYASRHGIIEYLTDAVFVLQYVRSETRETRLAVEIQKIRNANHSRETKPYEITMDGISVYQQANIF